MGWEDVKAVLKGHRYKPSWGMGIPVQDVVA